MFSVCASFRSQVVATNSDNLEDTQDNDDMNRYVCILIAVLDNH